MYKIKIKPWCFVLFCFHFVGEGDLAPGTVCKFMSISVAPWACVSAHVHFMDNEENNENNNFKSLMM